MKQIKIFQNKHASELEKEVNEFCKTHNVISVSYAVQSEGYGTWYHALQSEGYGTWYHACVFYDTNTNETNNEYDDGIYDENYIPADEIF